MTEKQQTAKYISRLRYTIQEHVAIHDVLSVNEAHNKAMKIEVTKQSSTFQASIVNRRIRRR